jgi:hypothetical protein
MEYSPEAVEHLAALTARQCATVLGIKMRDRVFVGREELKP